MQSRHWRWPYGRAGRQDGLPLPPAPPIRCMSSRFGPLLADHAGDREYRSAFALDYVLPTGAPAPPPANRDAVAAGPAAMRCLRSSKALWSGRAPRRCHALASSLRPTATNICCAARFSGRPAAVSDAAGAALLVGKLGADPLWPAAAGAGRRAGRRAEPAARGPASGQDLPTG